MLVWGWIVDLQGRPPVINKLKSACASITGGRESTNPNHLPALKFIEVAELDRQAAPVVFQGTVKR
jgi:hypothetical protein